MKFHPELAAVLLIWLCSIEMSLELPSKGTVRRAELEWKAAMLIFDARSSTSVFSLPAISANFGAVMSDLLLFDLLRKRIGNLGSM